MEKQVTEYTVVRYRDAEELAKLVQVKIQEGWQPWGSMVVGLAGVFYQTLVKYSPVDCSQTLH